MIGSPSVLPEPYGLLAVRFAALRLSLILRGNGPFKGKSPAVIDPPLQQSGGPTYAHAALPDSLWIISIARVAATFRV
jgi:hypothetical protein